MLSNKAINTCTLAALVLVTTGATAQAQTYGVNAGLVGRWNDYEGSYCDVWAEGDFAYVPNWGADGNAARIHILYIGDPANPILVRTFMLPSPNQFASPQDVKVADGLLFIALEGDPNDGVAIVDIRSPLNPAQVATVRVPNFSFIHNLFYDSGFLYMPRGTSIAIVDLTSFDPDNPPASPITAARWILTGVGSQFVHDVTVRNGRLYAAAWNSGLWIYDVSDVANTPPTFLGSVGGSATHSMWPTDDGRFVVTGEERGGGGIKVYEIIDNGRSVTLALRDSLVLTGTSSVHNQVFVGNRLYNSWYGRGLQVFDIDPDTGLLEFVAGFDTQDCWGVYPFLGDDRVLLTDMGGGLYIVKLGQAEPLVSPAAPHDTPKHRYLSVDTTANAGQPMALRVELTSMRRCSGLPGRACSVNDDCAAAVPGSGTCIQHADVGSAGPWWVQAPQQEELGCLPGPCGDEDWFARVDTDPSFQVWDSSTLHIGDCEIIPAATYEIRACAAPDAVVCSDPLIIGTIAQPLLSPGFRGNYGDAAGPVDAITQQFTPPDGFTNVVDVSAYILTKQNYGTVNKPQTHPTWVDLHGPGDGNPPQYIVNVSDLGQILKAFAGDPWTDDPGNMNPGQCP